MVDLQLINYVLNTKDYSIITLNNLDVTYFPNYAEQFEIIILMNTNITGQRGHHFLCLEIRASSISGAIVLRKELFSDISCYQYGAALESCF